MSIPDPVFIDDEPFENKFFDKWFRRSECPVCKIRILEECSVRGTPKTDFFSDHWRLEHLNQEVNQVKETKEPAY